MVNFEDYLNEDTLKKLKENSSDLSSDESKPSIKDFVLSPEEIEAYSEPSVMDEYIKKTDPEQYSKIQKANAIKGILESTGGVGGPIGVIGNIGKESAIANKGASKLLEKMQSLKQRLTGNSEPIQESFKELLSPALSKSDKIKLGLTGVGSGIAAYNLVPEQQSSLKSVDNQGMGPLANIQKYKEFLDNQKSQQIDKNTPVDENVLSEQKQDAFKSIENISPVETEQTEEVLPIGQESIIDAFKKTQEEDKQKRAMAMLAMGAGDILRGGLGLSYKVKVPEAKNKIWEEQLKSDDATARFIAEQEIKKEDPNSPISKRMREIVGPMLNKLGIQMPEGMSYSEIQKNFPQFSRMLEAQEREQERSYEKREARLEKQQQLIEKATEGQRQLDKDFAKQYNEWQSSGKSLYNKNLKRLEDAKTELKNAWLASGRIIGALPNFLRSEKGKRIQQDVQAAAQGSLKATLGAQFTEKEGERIMNMAYDPSLSPEENIRKIDMAIDEIKSNAKSNEERSKYFEQFGTLKGYSSSGQSKPDVELSDEDKQAIQWAKENPNDEDAKQILRMHGL